MNDETKIFSDALTSAGVQHHADDISFDHEMGDLYLPYDDVDIFWDRHNPYPFFVRAEAKFGFCDKDGNLSLKESTNAEGLQAVIGRLQDWTHNTKRASEWGFNQLNEVDQVWVIGSPDEQEDDADVEIAELEHQLAILTQDVEKALMQLEHAENILKACLLAAETNTVGASVAPEAIVIRRMVERYFAIKSLPF